MKEKDKIKKMWKRHKAINSVIGTFSVIFGLISLFVICFGYGILASNYLDSGKSFYVAFSPLFGILLFCLCCLICPNIEE